MKNKAKSLAVCAPLLLCLALLTACKPAAPQLYATVTYFSDDDNVKAYLAAAQCCQQMFAQLEEHCGAFVVDAYNYQDIDGQGTPLYTMNGMDCPAEISPNGQCIRVSKNYFRHNPIVTADGQDAAQMLETDDCTLNVLVPEKYRAQEDALVSAHRARFYFEKVTAENDYNSMAGEARRLGLREEDLRVNVIYVKDGQSYALYREDCAGGTVTDPVVQVYTGNIHSSYAFSFLSQWAYLPSSHASAQEAYQDALPYIEACGGQDILRELKAVKS